MPAKLLSNNTKYLCLLAELQIPCKPLRNVSMIRGTTVQWFAPSVVTGLMDGDGSRFSPHNTHKRTETLIGDFIYILYS